MHRVLGTVAVQKYWVTAELYGVHNLIGVNAVPNKAVFQLGLQSSTGACSMHRVLGFVAVQQCQVTAELYDVHNLKVSMQSQTRLFSAWVAEQHWCRQHAQGPRLCCYAKVLGYSRAAWGA